MANKGITCGIPLSTKFHQNTIVHFNKESLKKMKTWVDWLNKSLYSLKKTSMCPYKRLDSIDNVKTLVQFKMFNEISLHESQSWLGILEEDLEPTNKILQCKLLERK